MARLDVEGLSFTYPAAPQATLTNVSFGVASGGSLALLGSSGAGKTTLLNLLSGLIPCTDGKIRFDGVDVASVGAAQRGVAQVFQFPVLYESLSVRDNIGFPLRTRGVSKTQYRLRAEAVAELFDLSAVLLEKPAALSLFQKQLVGFAKALVRDDLALVLLDEPLTAVEPAMKWRLRGIVKRAQAELGITMVYVTHDQTEALTFADEVSVLHGGKVLQTGTPAELYERPAHAEVARFIGNPGMNVIPAEFASNRLRVSGCDALGVVPNPGGGSGSGEGPLEIGFRPEWGSLLVRSRSVEPQSVEPEQSLSGEREANSLELPATLIGHRLTGASEGKALAIARVAIGDTEAQVACELSPELLSCADPCAGDRTSGSELWLKLHRYRLFRDGWLL